MFFTFSEVRRVSLLGLFELSTRWGERPEGRSELAAARLAVKHVNQRKLLPGYYLHLLTNDTKVSYYIQFNCMRILILITTNFLLFPDSFNNIKCTQFKFHPDKMVDSESKSIKFGNIPNRAEVYRFQNPQ